MVDLTHKLPKIVKADRAKLYQEDLGDKFKFILLNESRNYRQVMFLSKEREAHFWPLITDYEYQVLTAK